MIGRLTFIAALTAASVTFAQEAPDQPPATPAQIAEARGIADRLIAEAGAQGVFVNKTDGAVATAEHIASGMRCHFDGSGDRIVVFPAQGGVPHGDDVGCVTRDENLSIDTTTYATRYRPLPSEDAVLADAATAIRNRWPDAVPFKGELVSATVGNQAAPKSAAFSISTPNGPMMTMILVGHTDEWGYKVRATGPAESAMMVSLYAGVLMAGLQDGDAED